MDKAFDHRNWRFRRRYLVVVTAFTMALMGFSVVYRADQVVSETVVSMGFVGLIGYVGSYVFGAVWDHNNIRAHTPEQRTPTNASNSPVADVSRDMDQA
jgi:hypothetical protein